MSETTEHFPIEACQRPRTAITKPKLQAPPGTTDCHFHIFGPHARYPLHPGRHYTPPEATVPDYQAMAATLGIERMVVVQPSIYATDNRCTLDAVAAFGPARARAVAVTDESITAPELRRLHEAGVRGVRFNAVNGNGTPLGQLRTLARFIAPLGWHVQLYLSTAQLLELAPSLGGLGVPVVIDHMAGVASDEGVAHPAFQALLRLLEAGRTWVKITFYRNSVSGQPFTDALALAASLIAAAPERCLWGTDWPHPNYLKPMPDDGTLLDLLGAVAPEARLRQRILAANPAELYGFPPLS